MSDDFDTGEYCRKCYGSNIGCINCAPDIDLWENENYKRLRARLASQEAVIAAARTFLETPNTCRHDVPPAECARCCAKEALRNALSTVEPQ